MLAIIAAKSSNNVIGFEGKMPWKQKNDLQRFKALTYGHTIVMGRKTYESMGRPLPGRDNVVLTTNIVLFCELNKDTLWPKPGNQGNLGATVCGDLETAIEKFYKMEFPHRMYLPTGFIIGGEHLYRQGMDKADLMYITELDCEVPGDAFFPEIDLDVWKVVSRETYKADADNQYDYSFVTYARKPVPLKGPQIS